jgi:8-oxo-dGTP pyrophosphatase MutT (NUDIX family)
MGGNQYLHEVAITAIIVKKGKFLIIRRAKNKKRFPGKWTVPGGKLETYDYLNLPRDTQFYWYNILEKVLKREIKEEVGISVKDIEYITSLATIHADGNPSLVISCMASYSSGRIKLQKDETDKFAWVDLIEIKKYDLLDGISDEVFMVDQKLKGKKVSWKRFKK